MTSTIWQIWSSAPNAYSRNANLTPFFTCKLSCIDQTNWLPNLSRIQMGPTPTWVTFVWLYKSDGLPAAAKALCLLPQQCLPRHSSPSATLQCWALIYFNTFQHFFFFLKINEEKRLLAVDFLLLFPVGHLDVHPPYCIKRFYDGKFIHLKKKDKQIKIKCTDVMPNRTFYNSAQLSALVTLQLSVVTIYCIGALIHHLASAACPCKTIYISFINHLSIHYTVEHSFVSWRDEKASTVVLCSTSACLSWYFHHNPGSNIWQFIWMAKIQKHNQPTNKRTRCMSIVQQDQWSKICPRVDPWFCPWGSRGMSRKFRGMNGEVWWVFS